MNKIDDAIKRARNIYAKTGMHQCLVQGRNEIAVFPDVGGSRHIMWTTRNDKGGT